MWELWKSKNIDHFLRAPATKTDFGTDHAQARENLEISSYKGDKIALFDCSWQLLRKSALRDTPWPKIKGGNCPPLRTPMTDMYNSRNLFLSNIFSYNFESAFTRCLSRIGWKWFREKISCLFDLKITHRKNYKCWPKPSVSSNLVSKHTVFNRK